MALRVKKATAKKLAANRKSKVKKVSNSSNRKSAASRVPNRTISSVTSVPKKRNDEEYQVQAAVVDHLEAFGNRDIFWCHIPNGEARHIVTAKRLKKMGVKSGTPDLLFIKQGRPAHWMELKAKNGVLSDNQRDTIDTLVRNGSVVAVCYGIDEAINKLRDWNFLR